ncbi:Methyltransf_29 domain-containing protein [Cephalotus follicularis]|uniref:Methyltransferase n=1 Tax=Cephalotus follicularis TaxID=3775 RepID=A0A1Q3D6Y8_CEPFO|nr:Methyltransf_29 domain-containing protein [Cephalotus follicularis]
MAISMQDLFKERKYPFIFTLSIFLFIALFFLFTTTTNNTTSKFLLSSLSDLHQPSRNVTVSHDNNNQRSVHVDPKHEWQLCKGTVAVDYIPCLDNFKAIKELIARRHMERRERHCPNPTPMCLIPLPVGYKLPVPWPKSRDMIWYNNVPHPKLVEYKKDQNWVRKSGDYFVFPGGGTQFKDGVTHYIDFVEKTLPVIEWGKHVRVILDVGCGVASFGGYLLDRDVITMSFAPKDEHEAQIQFALERGIPATLSVIGTQQLTYPNNAFDLIHCARCRVHWDADGGKPLLELNRVLRPGGFFVWSATPVYRNDKRDLDVWEAMVTLTKSMCWKVVAKTVDSTGIGLVIYQKPLSSSCYKKRKEKNPPLCDQKDSQHISWYVPLKGCLPSLPENSKGNLNSWPSQWPKRLTSKPPSLSTEPDAEIMFYEDTRHWSALVSDVYLDGLAINWSSVRNVMDMNAGYGGFAAALIDQPLWVMNVIPINAEDTLPIIFDRGLIGIYHDWCESFNTYPRTYDLLHSSFLLRNLTQRCNVSNVLVEMDRILRPGGYFLVQDTMDFISQLIPFLHSLGWSTNLYQDQFLIGNKGFWRPMAGKFLT